MPFGDKSVYFALQITVDHERKSRQKLKQEAGGRN